MPVFVYSATMMYLPIWYTATRRDKHTERMACNDGGRDWSDAFTSQGMPEVACSHQKLGEMHGTDYL